MTTKRLTKAQKNEILEAYIEGANTSALADRYKCSSNTINRTVKTLLPDNEYKLLKEKRSKTGYKKKQVMNNKEINFLQQNLIINNTKNHLGKEIKKESFKGNDDFIVEDKLSNFLENKHMNKLNIEEMNQGFDHCFEEIAPLLSSYEFEKKEIDFEILSQDILPESVYMLVDKKVELDVKLISDLSEWSFLPENELTRKAILLFSNQRTAKRSCSKNQRVIKIPDTNVFQISKSYLVEKGITRLILEDSIIGLDN
tara:strand:- start:1014 stop:1781 length:768 start_codon:yes stop_codon:yes gene_type:complete